MPGVPPAGTLTMGTGFRRQDEGSGRSAVGMGFCSRGCALLVEGRLRSLGFARDDRVWEGTGPGFVEGGFETRRYDIFGDQL